LELYTLAYEGRIEKSPIEAAENALDILMRDLFETARELGMQASAQPVSKTQLRQALLVLGFEPALPQSEMS
jgi:hypothetical protein